MSKWLLCTEGVAEAQEKEEQVVGVESSVSTLAAFTLH